MSQSTPPFGTQLIGQTEKALNAILDRLLAGSGLTEPQWVTLTIAVMSGGSIARGEYDQRVDGALKVGRAEAQARIAELATAGLLDVPADESRPVTVSEAGRELHGRIRARVGEITERLWGDLDAGDLAAAGRVLGIILERANGELARV